MRPVRALAAPLLLAALALAAAACATARNYPDPGEPRYSGSYVGQDTGTVVRVVSFNVKFAQRVDRAIEVLRHEPRLHDADVIAMQEMDSAGSEAVARALSLNYVYYPGAIHPRYRREFGNAILSRWPITEDHKLVLPHTSRVTRLERIAVSATVNVPGLTLRVYSVHLETIGNLSPAARRDQMSALLEDARASALPVVIAGDFNGRAVVESAIPHSGFEWLTRGVGRTISRFSWDHVLVRGLRARDSASVGSAPNGGASDHRPIWAELVAAPAPPGP